MKGAGKNTPVFSLDSSSEKSGGDGPGALGVVIDSELAKIASPHAPRSAPSVPLKYEQRHYAYRNPWVVRAFALLDRVGGSLFEKKRERPEILKRVLVLRPDHLGDVLFSFPALRALREELPDAQIDFLVGPWARPLLPEDPKDLHGVALLEFAAPWLVRPKKVRFGFGATLKLARLLRKRARALGGKYDMVLDLRGDFQLILAARLSGARYLVGRGLTGLGFLLDTEAEEIPGRHQVERNLSMIESAGFGPLRTTNPSLSLSEDEKKRGRLLLLEHGVDVSRILIGMHVGAGAATKLWGADRYAQLIKRVIADLPAQVILFGASGDRTAVNDVKIVLDESQTVGRVFDLCGKLPDLREFMMAASSCALFVG
ncbi:MAG: glycosyltransferase family 9 protein, partial [Nitrospinaceae bacterium]|nr:glycosyltransferase family 9 protein [Nitrospinaceae bacterium]